MAAACPDGIGGFILKFEIKKKASSRRPICYVTEENMGEENTTCAGCNTKMDGSCRSAGNSSGEGDSRTLVLNLTQEQKEIAVFHFSCWVLAPILYPHQTILLSLVLPILPKMNVSF